MAGLSGEQDRTPNQSERALADFNPPKKPKKNKYAIAYAVLASMTGILLGYDIGVMSGATNLIKKDLKITDVQLEILVGMIDIYSLLGSAAAGRTSDYIGRRYTIVVTGVIFFVGAILMGLAPNYALLMVGRFIAGVGVGYALTIAPVYTAEIAPASMRGFLASFPEWFIDSGILLGYISNYVFAKFPLKLGWRFMLGIGALPAILLAIGVLAMPESPRWLVMQGRLRDAQRVLERTAESKGEAHLRLMDIKEAAGISRECNDDVVQVQRSSHGEGVWKELLFRPTPAVLHILICAIGIHFFQEASGIDAIVLYSPTIFEKAGIRSSDHKLLATIAVGLVKTVFVLGATLLLDKVGRRPLLLTSYGVMILSLLTLGFGLTIIDHSDEKLDWAIGLCVSSVLVYIASFSAGAGPVAWVYTSEIFPLRLRAQGTSIGVAVNRLVSGVEAATFLSLYKAITIGGAFFLFAGIASVAWVFFYLFYPETRGKSLEDIEELFGNFIKWRRVLEQKRVQEENDENKGQIQGPKA